MKLYSTIVLQMECVQETLQKKQLFKGFPKSLNGML